MQIYLDSADLADIVRYAGDVAVRGFTTNPTLLRRAGVTNYAQFVTEAKFAAVGKPVSFEVIADEEEKMLDQALTIKDLAGTYPFYVKVPVVNSRNEPTYRAIERILSRNIPVNVTAVFTNEQIKRTVQTLLLSDTGSIVSIFAGRLGDLGIDPEPLFRAASCYRLYGTKKVQTLWASPREVFNVYQAERCGADIITLTPKLYEDYLKFKGYYPTLRAWDTAKMFYNDAKASGLTL